MDNEFITLTPPDDTREVVDEDRAIDFLVYWRELLANDANSKVVNKVVLTNKSYTLTAATMIGAYLKQKVSATTTILDLSDVIASRMTKEGFAVLKALCDAFEDATIVQVNLSDNAMGSRGIQQCRAVLKQTSLESVFLENNGLALESMADLADLWTTPDENGVCACDNLKVIHFYNNMSGDEGAVEFKRILVRCKNLEEIRYSGCRVKKPGSRALAEGLEEMGESILKLKKLNVLGSDFGTGEDEDSDGVIPLARALTGAKNLTHLNFCDVEMNGEAPALIAQALVQAGAPLVELDVSENFMGPDGAESLTDLLTTTVGTLKVFAAKENELTSVGVKRMVQALSSADSVLTELNLELNECGVVGAKALCNAVLPRLESIRLNENAFPADFVEKLEQNFGNRLQEMEDNDEDQDADEENGVEDDGESVDDLAEEMAGVHI